jgi:pimeloyl-ACP methyl ester carboxylesterase
MIRHGFSSVNDLTLHYASTGDSRRPLLLFLHGFPQFWYGWREQLLALGDTWHCAAPDLPGYNLSSKPSDVARYRAKYLLEDIVAFAAQVSPHKPFTLVAHDWGGALAWALAIRKPELIDRLVIINAVHPGAFQRELAKNPEQAKASQYIHALRAAGSEPLYAANDFELLWQAFADVAAAGHLTSQDRAAYIEAWSQPGALTGMFNWYRASRMTPAAEGASSPPSQASDEDALMVRVPTLVIWGMKDKALLPGCIDGLERWVPGVDIRRVPDGGHWIIHEKPDFISRTIRDWLNQ